MAAGDIVHVHWDVGTPYGLAGTTTRERLTVALQAAVAAGYGYFTLEPGDTPVADPDFGHDPIERNLTVSKGADFAQIIRPEGGVKFPEGTTARIDILNRATDVVIDSWDAEVTEDELRWTEQSTAVDAVPDRSKYRLYLSFPTIPTLEMLWYFGSVHRKQ